MKIAESRLNTRGFFPGLLSFSFPSLPELPNSTTMLADIDRNAWVVDRGVLLVVKTAVCRSVIRYNTLFSISENKRGHTIKLSRYLSVDILHYIFYCAVKSSLVGCVVLCNNTSSMTSIEEAPIVERPKPSTLEPLFVYGVKPEVRGGIYFAKDTTSVIYPAGCGIALYDIKVTSLSIRLVRKYQLRIFMVENWH